jgi:hypothetical protein
VRSHAAKAEWKVFSVQFSVREIQDVKTQDVRGEEEGWFGVVSDLGS